MKLKLCITNILETAPNSDECTVKNPIADQLELQKDVYNKLKSVRRIGKPLYDQPRLTLLTLETSEARRVILLNSIKLKDFSLKR